MSLVVIVCVSNDFAVTYDAVGMDAIRSHYKTVHPQTKFENWDSMKLETWPKPLPAPRRN